MKQILATVLLLTLSTTVFAQYYDDYYHPEGRYYQRSYHSGGYSDDLENGWGNFFIEYAPMKLVSSAKGVDDRTFHAATIGVSFDLQLGYNSPVYFEGGFETTGNWFSKRYNNGVKYTMDIYHSKIPVNLALRLKLAPGFCIVPYGGVNLKYNIYGQETEKDYDGTLHKWKLFEDNRTYDNDYRRFQFGYQAGVRIIMANCFSIGAAWKADVTSFCKYFNVDTRKEETEKFLGFSFQLAYCF